MSGARVSGIGRRLLAGVLLGLALVAVAAAPALAQKPKAKKPAAKPNASGRLDTSFGKGGKLTVAFPAESGGEAKVKYDLPYSYTAGHLEMAPAPGGKIVVAGATKMVRFLANGKRDSGFGSGGEVRIPRPPGMNFVLAAVAVDRQGRILLAGAARPMPVSSTPNPLLSSAMVMRFSADGSPDPSFGTGGTLITDLGFGPPKGAGGEKYLGPGVGIRSMVVDSEGRPVISGGYISEYSNCYAGSISVGFVGRLTAAGGLDPSFGEGGVRLVKDIASFRQVGFTPAGGLLAVGNGGRPCDTYQGGPALELAGFGGEGTLDPNFGFSGFRVVSELGNAPTVAIAPAGKIVLLGPPRNTRDKVKGHWMPVTAQPVTQLLPNGANDPSFARKGEIEIITTRGNSYAAVAVDAQGRLLLAGRAYKRVAPDSTKNPLRRSTFYISRMTAKGVFDRGFGDHGSVRTGFGGPDNVFATQVVLLNGGRMLVGGGISSPRLASGGGYAIAKYTR